MSDPVSLVVTAAIATIGLAATALVALRCWQDWLEVKRLELERRGPRALSSDLAVLRERVRRLEAIANGGDF
jgi:hypothetical protein